MLDEYQIFNLEENLFEKSEFISQNTELLQSENFHLYTELEVSIYHQINNQKLSLSNCLLFVRYPLQIYFFKIITTALMIDKTKTRNQLFSTLKETGLQEQLKKHLRVQICEKLKKNNLIGGQNPKKSQQKLYHRVLASMISQQLKTADCGYSMSIYVVEAGFQDNMLSREQLTQILNIKNSELDGKLSILSNLMHRRYPFNASTVQNCSIQTSPQEIGYTVEQKLMLIDQQFRRNLLKEESDREKFINSQLLKRRQLQGELKKQYERDLERFKEFQINIVQVKVGQHWRKKYQERAVSLEQDYQRKFDLVRKKQKLMEEDLIKKTKNLDYREADVQNNLKKKTQLLDLKSSTIQQQLENMDTATKNSQKQIRNKQTGLREKVRQYDDLLLGVNKKIDYETNISRLSIQQEYQQKEMQLITRKKFVDEEYGKLMAIKDTCDLIERDNKRVHSENQAMRDRISNLERDHKEVFRELGTKIERIDSLQQAVLEEKYRGKSVSEELKESQRKMKVLQKDVLEMRKELEPLRKMKEISDEEEENRRRSDENIDINSGKKKESDLARKLEALKQKRRKDIEKFKLEEG